MPKSLAEMRKSESVGLPERTYPVCLAGKVVAEIETLETRLDLIEDRPATNGRVGAKSEKKKLEEEIEALREVMHEHLAEVRFRAKPGHEWRSWVTAHPPREGESIDRNIGLDIDGAINDLPDFILSVNGEPVTKNDWTFVVENASDGDLKGCVGMLIAMHNGGVDIPKSRLSSRKTEEP